MNDEKESEGEHQPDEENQTQSVSSSTLSGEFVLLFILNRC